MFYKQVTILCNQRGISLSKLIAEIGLSTSNATYWKKGSTPKADTVQRIADYFNVSTDYLLVGNKNNANQSTFSEEDIALLWQIKNLSPISRKEVESHIQFKQFEESKKNTSATIAT